MELSNEFTVDVAMDEAWRVLTDLQRIAPCMPGASLEAVNGDDFVGSVKVKVGPITSQYRGTARFVERDEGVHRAVVRAEGRETRGQGSASAVITATLEPAGAATHVSVVTELNITGRAAQFGRGVLADVSNKLLGQFVESLETTVLGEPSPRVPAGDDGAVRSFDSAVRAPGAPSSPTSGATAAGKGLSAGAVAPINALSLIGPSLMKRIVPLAALAAVLALFGRLLRARRRGR